MKTLVVLFTAALACQASTIGSCPTGSAVMGFEDYSKPGTDNDHNDMIYMTCGLSFDTIGAFNFVAPTGYSETPFSQPASYFDYAITSAGSTTITFLSSQTLDPNDQVYLSLSGGAWQLIGPGLTLTGIVPGLTVDFKLNNGVDTIYALPQDNRDGYRDAVVYETVTPEPGTWAFMALGGLWLIAVSLRVRRIMRNR